MFPKTVRVTPRVNAGGPRDASSAASAPDTAKPAEKQRQIDAAARLRHLARVVHLLGERPLFELFLELDRGADLRDAPERFARVASLTGFIAECGADRLPQLRVVGG
jgi:hypothetical protein